MDATTSARTTVEGLTRFIEQALAACGVVPAQAQIAAEVLATTDSWGVFTHGSKLLSGYVRRLRKGGLRTDAEPRVAAEGPAWALVDGESVLGQAAAAFAMRQAIAKARATGIGYVGVRNSCHFGAAGYYAWMAAREGLIGMAMANDVPSVAAPGSRRAVLGSNPLAYAIPAERHPPILLDISIATVAGGKVYARRRRGEPIPPDWLIGPDGRPTVDGSLYPQEAALAPMGGHKGYGLGLLIETLSAVATGAAVTHRVGSWMFDDGTRPTDHGAALLAIDAACLAGDGQFLRRVDALIDELHAAPAAEGSPGVLVPGELEWRRRAAALQEGLDFPEDVRSVLREVADELALDPPC